MGVIVRFSEPERREKYAKRYGIRVLIWLAAIVISFILVQFLVKPVTCELGQAIEWNTICQNCQMEHCLDCGKAGKDGCDQLKEGYIFDELTQTVISDACQMDHCAVCQESGVYGCDICEIGYKFNQLLGFCQSTVC